MQVKSMAVILLTLISLLISPFILAHTGTESTAGLADGFMHTMTGLDHLLVAIAVGFWVAQSGDHRVRNIVYFISFLLDGMLLGAVCLAFPQLQLLPALIVVLSVVLVALSITAPQYVAYIFFGGFAIYHGIVHILEMPAPVMAVGYIAGLLISTGLLLLLGIKLRQWVMKSRPLLKIAS